MFQKTIFKFSIRYFSYFFILFLIEVLIALFVRDNFVRPYLGDVIAIILLYCLIKSFLHINVISAALISLIIGCVLEFFQWIQLLNILRLSNSKILNTVLGATFSWEDICCYFIGFIFTVLLEKCLRFVQH